MWAICDIAMHLIFTKSTTYDTREFPLEARIPSMYYQAQTEDFQNNRIYLPSELYNTTTIGHPVNNRKIGIAVSLKFFFFFQFTKFIFCVFCL